MVVDISKAKSIEDLKNMAPMIQNEEKTNLLTSYTEYKHRLDFELQKQAEGFVRVGYLLKVARDTNVLKESGYKSVAEFAQAEYGLSKDVVSRYIAVNDRYSEGGYSDRLQAKFEGYGYSKLTEMLTLPDEIVSEIDPTATRKEIQEIKKEIAEEEKISPMEVAMEAAEQSHEQELTKTQRIWLEYFRSNREEFIKLKGAIEGKEVEALIDTLAPSGNAVLWTRIPGIGKIMITVKNEHEPVVMTNVRDFTKDEQKVEETLEDLLFLFGQTITKRTWEKVYGEAFEKDAAKTDIKPQKTAENDIKPQKTEAVQEESVIKTEESVIKTKDPVGKEEEDDEEDAEGFKNDEIGEEQTAEPEEREEEQAAESVTDFMPEPEPAAIGYLKVTNEKVAPVQQDTSRIIEVKREVNKEEFGISDQADHSECKEKLKLGLKNFKAYMGAVADKVSRAQNFHWDDKRLYDELADIFEEALNRTQEARAALEFLRKIERETEEEPKTEGETE